MQNNGYVYCADCMPPGEVPIVRGPVVIRRDSCPSGRRFEPRSMPRINNDQASNRNRPLKCPIRFQRMHAVLAKYNPTDALILTNRKLANTADSTNEDRADVLLEHQ